MGRIRLFVREHAFAFAFTRFVAVHFDFVRPLVRVAKKIRREGGWVGGREG